MERAPGKRRVALVCATPKADADELKDMRMPSYGIRRIQAAVLGDPELREVELALFDRRSGTADLANEICAFDPHIVGLSVYVWSAPFLIDVARELKKRLPGVLIVFGGPSARTAFFDLTPYRPAAAYLDAVVEGDGEEIFVDLVKSELSASAWTSVVGLALPIEGGWKRTGKRAPPLSLDRLASPYALGQMETGAVAYLETFRGCPLSCRFCEWGAKDNVKATFSVDYIAREIEAFERLQAPAVFLLDAGLNLNMAAFRNLRAANARSGALKRMLFWAEIYPSVIRDEHLAFLQEVGSAYLGVGMQSMDPEVLRLQDRPADSPRFEAAVRALAQVTEIELQIIVGLPGDTPDGFRRTLAYARSLPANVRVYHCLVLPDALLTRSRPGWDLRFDPRNLTMRSCLGWSRQAIEEMRIELRKGALAAGGKAGDFWWSFPRHRARRLAAG